ncbi:MAG: dihydrolipoamide dehydrogenase [Hyphomicrobiaceae bacterium]|jgi:dihydrolipoamide dehydrogenase
MDRNVDIAIVGGGPGGYVAALRARELGLTVALVERDALGGVCANIGCIPTKALLHVSELWTEIAHADKLGITVETPRFDLAKAVEHSRSKAARMSRGVKGLLARAGVDVVAGRARLAAPNRLAVEVADGSKEEIVAGSIILATGARPRELAGLEADGRVVWTSRDALLAERLPSSLLVVGAGAIGMEFASFYSAFGVEVTVVEQLERILPPEDEEIATLARKAFVGRGIRFHLASSVVGLTPTDNGAQVLIRNEQGDEVTVEVERVLVAAGIVANTEDLGLEGTRVKLERGRVVTDCWAQTDEPGIYAIGDLTAGPWLAHKASREGIVAVEAIAGVAGAKPFDAGAVPGCTYTLPQIASIGLTETQARDAGRDIRVGRSRLAANGKATAVGATEGMVKTIFDAVSGELLGAHLIGSEATELVATFAVARSLETTEVELAATVFPHPTISEAIGESVLDAFGRALHG